MSRRSIPPLRVCPVCGGHHRAWAETEPCLICRAGALEDAQATATLVREQRDTRCSTCGLVLDGPDAIVAWLKCDRDPCGLSFTVVTHEDKSPVPYNEFPPGF